MFKVGDLVKRIKVLNFSAEEKVDLMIDHTISDDVGIILEIEKAEIDNRIYTLRYPECFIKVLWQGGKGINPLWHWGEELEAINEKNS